MLLVDIANHKIKVYGRPELLKVFKDETKIPKEYLPLGVLTFYAWWDDINNPRTWLEIAGRDVSRIDMAVPQAWWDHYYSIHKEAPRACWSYEEDRMFGKALMWDQVREQVRAKIAVRVKRLINAAVGEGTL